jgi:hypothetical protein
VDLREAPIGSTQPGQPGVAPEAVGTNRLDLSTSESAMVVPEDTPAPITALGLASVRREAAANRFSDGVEAPAQHDGWDTWVREGPGTDERIRALTATLRGHSWLRRLLRRG